MAYFNAYGGAGQSERLGVVVILDPLTRLAPADESAGCETPSPPKVRGLVNSNEGPLRQNEVPTEGTNR